MPQDLLSFNLAAVDHNSFFNSEELPLVEHINLNGTGFYKLTQMKIGAFVSAEKVTELAEDVYEASADRILVEGSEQNFLYILVA